MPHYSTILYNTVACYSLERRPFGPGERPHAIGSWSESQPSRKSSICKRLHGDGHFMMFSGLLSQIEKHNRLNISRNAIGAMKDFEKVGDLSSHSRRFNAPATDIDPLRQSLRVASEDLLHLSGQG